MSELDLLPLPPTSAEKYRYFGRRHRWLPFYMFASFLGVIYALVRLSLEGQTTRLLWAFATLLTVYAYISFRTSARSRRFDLTDHRRLADEWHPEVIPSVDVYLPSCGEPLEVLANTYRWVSTLRWDGELTVYVLDDSARPEVAEMAASHGFQYLTRPNRGYMKKAGNLAYAYTRSSGDLILILDADFAPRSDMLEELVPYFGDPKIGIVQSPQFFDQHAAFNWVQRASGSVQTLFYRYIQPARDKVNGAICVGTNAIYRRAALDDSAGFAQINHSEDVHTGVNLIVAGYTVRYVPVVLAKGLCPDTLAGYVNMVYRWCTGSMSLMIDPKFRSASLRPAQRACYWTGFIFYMASALYVLVGSLPSLLMVWCFPADVHPSNVIPLLPSIIGMLVICPALFGNWRVLELMRLNLVAGYCFLFAIVDFARGRSAAWVPTGAAKSGPAKKGTVEQKVVRGLRWWGSLIEILIWAGIGRGIAEYGFGEYWVMTAFAALVLCAHLGLIVPGHSLPRPPRRVPVDAAEESSAAVSA